MTPEQEKRLREDARNSLLKIQDFDAKALSREIELGALNNFRDAVAPAERLVNLFNQLAPESLDDFGTEQLEQLKSIANQCHGFLDQLLKLNPKNDDINPQSMINKIMNIYQQAFNIMHPMISYSLYKLTDFKKLNSEIKDTLKQIKNDVSIVKQEADNALKAIRNAAAEQGVTQQSNYFKKEADKHEIKAIAWIVTTILVASLLVYYAIISISLHKLLGISIENTFELVQISISKFLIFAVISFMLYFSAKNYLSNKHNATVNRHRQNALLTYQTLVEAANEKQSSDVVLVHAASCIYAPQPTGYIGNNAETPGAKSVIELLSKSATDKRDDN